MNRGLSKAFVDELKTIWKDEGVIIFFILVPMLYPLLYSWIYTNEVVREVPVAVVDLSHSDMSRDFIRKFDASPDTRIACYCNSLDEAKDAIGRQDAFGVIYFPTDFQTNIMRMEQSVKTKSLQSLSTMKRCSRSTPPEATETSSYRAC